MFPDHNVSFCNRVAVGLKAKWLGVLIPQVTSLDARQRSSLNEKLARHVKPCYKLISSIAEILDDILRDQWFAFTNFESVKSDLWLYCR